MKYNKITHSLIVHNAFFKKFKLIEIIFKCFCYYAKNILNFNLTLFIIIILMIKFLYSFLSGILKNIDAHTNTVQ